MRLKQLEAHVSYLLQKFSLALNKIARTKSNRNLSPKPYRKNTRHAMLIEVCPRRAISVISCKNTFCKRYCVVTHIEITSIQNNKYQGVFVLRKLSALGHAKLSNFVAVSNS